MDFWVNKLKACNFHFAIFLSNDSSGLFFLSVYEIRNRTGFLLPLSALFNDLWNGINFPTPTSEYQTWKGNDVREMVGINYFSSRINRLRNARVFLRREGWTSAQTGIKNFHFSSSWWALNKLSKSRFLTQLPLSKLCLKRRSRSLVYPSTIFFFFLFSLSPRHDWKPNISISQKRNKSLAIADFFREFVSASKTRKFSEA